MKNMPLMPGKLNHREEIERDLRRSREIYAAHAPKQASIPT